MNIAAPPAAESREIWEGVGTRSDRPECRTCGGSAWKEFFRFPIREKSAAERLHLLRPGGALR